MASAAILARVIRTLSLPPFLPNASTKGGSEGNSFPERLQLAAVSVLRALVSGEGAKYVIAVGKGEQDGKSCGHARSKEAEGKGEQWDIIGDDEDRGDDGESMG